MTLLKVNGLLHELVAFKLKYLNLNPSYITPAHFIVAIIFKSAVLVCDTSRKLLFYNLM